MHHKDVTHYFLPDASYETTTNDFLYNANISQLQNYVWYSTTLNAPLSTTFELAFLKFLIMIYSYTFSLYHNGHIFLTKILQLHEVENVSILCHSLTHFTSKDVHKSCPLSIHLTICFERDSYILLSHRDRKLLEFPWRYITV